MLRTLSRLRKDDCDRQLIECWERLGFPRMSPLLILIELSKRSRVTGQGCPSWLNCCRWADHRCRQLAASCRSRARSLVDVSPNSLLLSDRLAQL